VVICRTLTIQVGFALRLIAFPEVFDLLTDGSPPGGDYTPFATVVISPVYLVLRGFAF